jgi:two-component system, OmpR family, sensor kinase
VSGVEFVEQTPTQAPMQAQPAPEVVAPEALPSPDRPQRLGRRSLTSRLIIGVGMLVVILVGVVGGGTYLALRVFMLHRLDQQVKSTALQNAAFFDTCMHTDPVVTPNGLICPVNGPVSQHEWITLLRPDGTLAARVQGRNITALKLSADQRAQLASSPGKAQSLTINGTQLRVMAQQTSDGLIVVTGLDTSEVGRVMRRLLGLELIIGGSAIGLALIITYAGVRLSLRGLRQVTTTAQEVAAELGPSGVALQRRVPVTEEGTEIAQLTDSMNTLLQATETQFAARVESEERMRQFLADASHELRTPLTSIRGYAELARMQRAAGHAEAEDNLGRIEAEGTRMSRLVEDLLLLARGDAAGAEPQRVPVDVSELIHEAVDGAKAAYPERTIVTDAMVSTWVIGDPDQLLRVVRNLITNAVVHTRPGPAIRARGFTDGNWVAIQIVDGGPGLPPEEAAHVFERFWRADKARTRARGGSGLGLSIVAAIVQAHGGTVRFDSSVEAGSTVTIWLPAAS